MDDKLTIISRAMQNLDKAARLEIKTEEDKLLIASALMAVTRNLYIETIGADDTAHVFARVADSFFIDDLTRYVDKPTIH